jgi:hypothetical protein
MDGMLAASSGLVMFLGGLAIVLIIWFFWWQHARAYGYGDEYVDEVHHHYHDDEDDDDDGYDDGYDEREAVRRPAVDLDAVRVGATLDIHNYPEDGDKTRFKASQRNRYVLELGGRQHTWYEFKLLGPDEATWLEWEHDDGLVITQWADEEIPLSDLDTTPAKIKEIGSNEQGALRYDGVRYNFVNGCEAKCFENDGVDGADFESWTFEADDGVRLLSVMLWRGTGGSATGRTGWYLDADEIDVV